MVLNINYLNLDNIILKKDNLSNNLDNPKNSLLDNNSKFFFNIILNSDIIILKKDQGQLIENSVGLVGGKKEASYKGGESNA